MLYLYSTSAQAKEKVLRDDRAKLRQVAKLLGIPAKKPFLRTNPGGPAVWGEVALHGDWIYIQYSRSHSQGILIRTCTSTKDYVGGRNFYLPADATPERIANFATELPALERTS